MLRNNFYVEVKPISSNPLERFEKEGENVFLESGQEFCIFIQNNHKTKAKIEIAFSNKGINTFTLEPFSSRTLTKTLEGQRLIFQSSPKSPYQTGITKNRSTLITLACTPFKRSPDNLSNKLAAKQQTFFYFFLMDKSKLFAG